MAYTPSGNKAKSAVNNFGGVAVDGNRVAMVGFGSNFATQDATASPLQSPLTVNTTATLTVPQNAVSCTLISTTNAVQVSEDSTQGSYFTLPAATVFTVDCTRQQFIYLKTASSTVVNFLFKTV